jgi:hypothetical protein
VSIPASKYVLGAALDFLATMKGKHTMKTYLLRKDTGALVHTFTCRDDVSPHCKVALAVRGYMLREVSVSQVSDIDYSILQEVRLCEGLEEGDEWPDV